MPVHLGTGVRRAFGERIGIVAVVEPSNHPAQWGVELDGICSASAVSRWLFRLLGVGIHYQFGDRK